MRRRAALLALSTATSAVVGAGLDRAPIEVHVTDHAPGIADFARLEVSLGGIDLHRRGQPRRDGWSVLVESAGPVDIVPLKDGVTRLLVVATVETGNYDAVRVRFAGITGELRSGGVTQLRGESATVRFALRVDPHYNLPLVVDLYVEDQTDHARSGYVVRVRELRRVARALPS